ncbi:unnamed protein product [Boreogadus saida]
MRAWSKMFPAGLRYLSPGQSSPQLAEGTSDPLTQGQKHQGLLRVPGFSLKTRTMDEESEEKQVPDRREFVQPGPRAGGSPGKNRKLIGNALG